MRKSYKKVLGIIAIVVLIILPLRHVREGVDITDMGFNLYCFRWFGTPYGRGMLMTVFYLSNLLGHIMTLLPGGSTWLGMNVYTSLVVSVMAVLAFVFLREMTGWIPAFVGIYLAIMLCWCPQLIMYNYLTYLGLLAGIVLLFAGIICTEQDNKDNISLNEGESLKDSKINANVGSDKKNLRDIVGNYRLRYVYFLIAGIVLGLGVGVRFANLTHMALILALWYDGLVKKRAVSAVVRDTLVCVAGYVIGMGSFIAGVSLQYGLSEYLNMIGALKTMSDNVEGYSGFSMLIAPYLDYLDAFWPWGFLLAGYTAAGIFVYRLLGRSFPSGFSIVYFIGLILLIRILYGRGMFGIYYHEYFSMVRWVGLFNLAAIIINAYSLADRRIGHREKLLSLIALIVIFIVPLGSNNKSYPLINNLFLVAPVTLFHIKRLVFVNIKTEKNNSIINNTKIYNNDISVVSKGESGFITPIQISVTVLLSALLIQATGFGTVFIFRDGGYGESRDTRIESNRVLNGMYTRAENAAAITEVSDFWQQAGLDDRKLILYGDVPGFSFILDAPCALSTSWSNLGSYNMDQWQQDFELVESGIEADRPVIIIGREYEPEDEKYDLLMDFIEKYDYKTAFENKRFWLLV